MIEIQELNIVDTERQLPDGSILKLYVVDSYHVMIGFVNLLARDHEGTRSRGIAFSACTCPEGFQSIPLTIAALKPKACSHVSEVIKRLATDSIGGL